MATMEDIVQPGQGPAQWRQSLCGRPGTRLLSLEKSVADSENTTITGGFDVDSIVGFIPGLGSIRKGLSIFYSPQFNRNLRNNIHIKLSVDITGPDGEPQRRLYAPKDMKHFCMGYIDGMNDLCVYILFPGTVATGDRHQVKESFLSDHDLSRFMNEVLWPAVKASVSALDMQHIPQSYEAAKNKTKALKVEMQGAVLHSPSYSQALTFFVNGSYLPVLWQAILHFTARLRNVNDTIQDLANPALLISGKNYKLQLRGDNPVSVIQSTFEVITSVFNAESINTVHNAVIFQ
ncbi:hypothetical protein V1523DRAFT_157424 [Lipomyces doorenjongii]